ncbi:hypothetical protein DQP57_15640 [Mycobacterium colombiense]|uniref:13e12 repeat-containing protein n=1 Tax=Mycobacterium colombiense TaxID=339268 RepID=A0A329LN35_9MYCO|nr:hypothetical protein DQP57_15640 [Mycobacterium colombiense]
MASASTSASWDWREQQLADGTLILVSPAGQTYVTTPGSALLFPSLCAPTGDLPPPTAADTDYCTERAAMMPRRRRTRAQDRAQCVAAERRHNRDARLARAAPSAGHAWPTTHGFDEDPPPF